VEKKKLIYISFAAVDVCFALVLVIREVSGSNVGQEIGDPDCFLVVFLSLGTHAGIVL
jgi:hypothetical protein